MESENARYNFESANQVWVVGWSDSKVRGRKEGASCITGCFGSCKEKWRKLVGGRGFKGMMVVKFPKAVTSVTGCIVDFVSEGFVMHGATERVS